MDRENNVCRYSRNKRYEKHLSPFGKKVLDELLKQWNKANNNIRNTNEFQNRPFPAQSKKVLTFNDESVVDTPYTMLLPPNSCGPTYLEEKALTFNLTHKPVPEVPHSVELIKTVPNTTDIDDFFHLTIAANKNLVYDIYNEDSEDKIPLDVERDVNRNKCSDINWDDMLDTELLDDVIANDKTYENKELNGKHKIFDIRFPNKSDKLSTTNIISDNNDVKKGQKRKINKKSTIQNIKKVRSNRGVAKNQQSSKESAGAKQATQTNNLRKQKYTKTVSIWLDNVEPHHSVGEGKSTLTNTHGTHELITSDSAPLPFTEPKALSNKTATTTTITHKDKIVIDKSLQTTKKVVQAQLANKDGIMKFSKPKNNVETNNNVEINENKPKISKEKKVKKFIAPIKSQIPVNDITYAVRTVNEKNVEDFDAKLREISEKEIIAMLIYSNGFCQLNSHHTDDTCAPDGVIINYDDMFYCFKNAGENLKKTLKYLFENNKVVCYGGRSVLIYLASYLQMEIYSINMYDAKIGASLLDPDNLPENFSDVQKLVSYTAPFTIATECSLQKSAWYMTLLKECWTKLYERLVEDALWKVFVEIEMKLLPIITEMERRGVLIDFVKLKSMEEVLLNRMKLVEQQCYKAAGKVFQINSAVQVRAILYDELQLDTKCNVKIKETICKGAKSTCETMLRSLVSEHPLPKLILEYRHLHKAHATFLTGIAQHVKDGIVTPTWVQTAAATGRIASNNPNLQAIPKAPFSLVMFPDGDQNAHNEQLVFRSVYVSRAGYSLVAADFKHVECRVFAAAAADSALLHALHHSLDLFKLLAAKWLNKPEVEISPEERERTKRLVYASLYGAGTRKLMEILDVSYEQALQVIASFSRTFPSLKSFGRCVVSRCAAAGGRLTTLCGRGRRFTNISSQDLTLKSHAERQAVNFIVQDHPCVITGLQDSTRFIIIATECSRTIKHSSPFMGESIEFTLQPMAGSPCKVQVKREMKGSAADLCKMAMILTEEQLRSSSPAVDAHLVLQIHDELVWEVNDQQVDTAAVIIKTVMEGCGYRCGMPVTLPIALSVGKNWGHMDAYETSIPTVPTIKDIKI